MTSDASIYLPEEIIELILSKCPVKSVVRFKSVSKSWQSIISNPRLSRIHLIHHSKLSEYQNKFILLAHDVLGAHIYLIRLEKNRIFRTESVLPYPSSIFNLPLCSCNGLILLGEKGNNNYFMLWNPSIRKVIMIMGPHTSPRPRLHHFYYDSTIDDHKIVFVYEKCYTVYSCKKGSWSEMKGFPWDLSCLRYPSGASVDGSFYSIDVVNGEIVCFDTRDANLHKFRQPINDMDGALGLEEVSGRLYFSGLLKDGERSLKKWVIEKNRSLKKWRAWRKLINMERRWQNYL